jgi:hypothetical protein
MKAFRRSEQSQRDHDHGIQKPRRVSNAGSVCGVTAGDHEDVQKAQKKIRLEAK